MMSLVKLTVLIFTAVYSVHSAVFDGDKVIRVVPHNANAQEFINSLHENAEMHELDFWQMSKLIGHPADIMVKANNLQGFLRLLKDNGIQHSVMVNDVGARIDEEEKERAASAFSSTYNYAVYNDYDSMLTEMENLRSKYSNIVTLVNIGTTFESRKMVAIKISTGSDRKSIWIDCGIHAREWISPATCMYTMNYLLKNNGKLDNVTALLTKYDWILLPSMNPDGYALTMANRTDRLWRKNTSPNGRYGCKGTDLNRNWDFEWSSGIGTSTYPCSLVYKGTSAFSEKETAAVSQYLLKLKGKLGAYFSIHSYSQMWLTPWGHTKVYPTNYDEISRVTAIGVKAIAQKYGTKYTHGPSPHLLYAVSGSSSDWVGFNLNLPYSFVLELRDTGKFGFQLPADQIVPTAEETIDGILASVQSLP